ncbi:hypothetical protein Spb1_38370 [Planctopirus ephydatiae]|uniref:H repeat-associated protein N-terminal domain-containing protein n=1 Tax=Planctopirus ephydatiae TaxID=2528019 RepID=A0A518GTG8_9PLAN|nr:transposase family protein [Planctopirus ephydatiae]QDV31891.1 hypothetical protein Spb1_38370 [Planctopirus ephydatiae]
MSTTRLPDRFAELTDPRRRAATHSSISVVFIALCAVVCGYDDLLAIST